MSILTSKDNRELVVSCKCGCDDSVHIKIDDEDGYFALMTYMNGNWYRDQNDKIFRTIEKKLKKIWAIIRNKDYYYSDIIMNKDDFQIFKNYINKFGEYKEEQPD